ncbi:hypothetical protein [uncultured Rikenella sp.]|uniref:hypothetical protein n=1 Tax=uncultured Rikenella sp. TaxID=368003 RepID=UPI00260AF14A|nr:hypothetical protein [uncultured Rikenella sp.]
MLARFDKISQGARTMLDRARSLKKEIIQTQIMRLNKISVSARTKNGAKSWAVGSFRMRQHPSKVFLVLFVHKENSLRRVKARPARDR